MNMQALMKQAQQMQKDMLKTKDEIESAVKDFKEGLFKKELRRTWKPVDHSGNITLDDAK